MAIIKKTLLSSLVVAGLTMCGCANSSVVMSSTRVIYNENDKEENLQIKNTGVNPALVQVWVDDGNENSNPDNTVSPFVITPPIFRIEPGKSQTIRIVNTDSELPDNKESVYWLNILDVPPLPKNNKENKNYMQVAFKSRMKIFYRPDQLTGNSTDSIKLLKWNFSKDGLNVKNETAYNVSIASIKINCSGGGATLDGEMIEPFSNKIFDIKNSSKLTGTCKLNYESISDYGSSVFTEINVTR